MFITCCVCRVYIPRIMFGDSPGARITKQICSVPLFSRFFRISKSPITYSISLPSHWHLSGVTTPKLKRPLQIWSWYWITDRCFDHSILKNRENNGTEEIGCLLLISVAFRHIGHTIWSRDAWRFVMCTLQWRHNERHGVSGNGLTDCFLNCLNRRRSRKTSRLCWSPLTKDQ